MTFFFLHFLYFEKFFNDFFGSFRFWPTHSQGFSSPQVVWRFSEGQLQIFITIFGQQQQWPSSSTQFPLKWRSCFISYLCSYFSAKITQFNSDQMCLFSWLANICKWTNIVFAAISKSNILLSFQFWVIRLEPIDKIARHFLENIWPSGSRFSYILKATARLKHYAITVGIFSIRKSWPWKARLGVKLLTIWKSSHQHIWQKKTLCPTDISLELIHCLSPAGVGLSLLTMIAYSSVQCGNVFRQ